MAPLLKKLGHIQIEHTRVCLSIDALNLLTPSESARRGHGIKPSHKRVLKPEGTKRIKQMVLEILEKHSDGLKALDILSKIEADYDMFIS